MDWIRLGASGKDLTGLRSRAGTLEVTKEELAEHNSREDAWCAIRGKVYNVTQYFPFHPGGVDQLMKGVGIDSTKLFEMAHPWVNYEQILQKCLVGRLVSIDSSIDTTTLFFGENSTSTDNPLLKNENQESTSVNPTQSLPRFDWIQKLDFITVIFYTKAFSNPLVEIEHSVDEDSVLISLSYVNTVFKNELVFYDNVRWPCDISVTIEIGKVELIFRKSTTGVWKNYGVLKQHMISVSSIPLDEIKSVYILKNKIPVNYNVWLLKFEREDGQKIVAPIGQHIRAFANIEDEDVSRSYTVVPESLFEKYIPHSSSRGNICLMIKRYPKGKMSKYITDRNLEDHIEFSKPIGAFDLKVVENRETFLMLAAGTGITPMLGLISFLLERRIKKCQFIRLLFFNTAEKDMIFPDKLKELMELDKRFKVDFVLSNATDSWNGHRGRVNAELIENSLQEHLKDTGYSIKDIYGFICGPPMFNKVALEEAKKVNLTEDQMYTFAG